MRGLSPVPALGSAEYRHGVPACQGAGRRQGAAPSDRRHGVSKVRRCAPKSPRNGTTVVCGRFAGKRRLEARFRPPRVLETRPKRVRKTMLNSDGKLRSMSDSAQEENGSNKLKRRK